MEAYHTLFLASLCSLSFSSFTMNWEYSIAMHESNTEEMRYLEQLFAARFVSGPSRKIISNEKHDTKPSSAQEENSNS